jgi:hypothetical protein
VLLDVDLRVQVDELDLASLPLHDVDLGIHLDSMRLELNSIIAHGEAKAPLARSFILSAAQGKPHLRADLRGRNLHKSDDATLESSVIAANIVDGQIEVFPVVYQAPELTSLSRGTIDLRSERIDLALKTRPRRGLGISASALVNRFVTVGPLGVLSARVNNLSPGPRPNAMLLRA